MFELCVASMNKVCEAIEAGHDLPCSPDEYVKFPDPISPSQIIQLGEAVTSLTGVSAEFGLEDNREEPIGCVFVDRLDAAWVSAASLLEPSTAKEIGIRWVAACTDAEREKPPWAEWDKADVVGRFLNLCKMSVATNTDLVMVWEL